LKRKKKSKLQKKKEDHNSSLWRNKADKAWGKLIHLIYDEKCAICSSNEYVQAHHFIPREMSSHRHIVLNGVILCCSHHKYSFELSPHKAPIAFYKWLIGNDPDRLNWLLSQKPSRELAITYKDAASHLETEYLKRLADKEAIENKSAIINDSKI
jgi:hypothetical protein